MMMNNTAQWQRLPTVSLVFFFLKSIEQLVKQGYQMIPALASVWIFVERIRVWVPLIIGVAAAVFVLVVVLRYLRFRYQVTATRVRVKQGVLKRSELNLDLERIQQADIQLPWYLRPFNLRVVRLESAGSKGQEVVLVGLTEKRALAIQHAVQVAKVQKNAQQDVVVALEDESNKTETLPAAADLDLHLNLTDTLKIGLMQNPFLVVGLFVGFLFSNSVTRDFLEGRLEAFIGDHDSKLIAALFLVAIAVGVLILVVLGSVLITTNTYFGYHLQRYDQRYSYSAGFLSKLSRSFSIRKLQGVVVRQGIAGLVLKRFSSELSQAGGVSGKKERFLVPSLTVEQKHYLLNDLQVPEVQAWEKMHPWSISRWLLLPSIVLGAILSPWVGFAAVVVLLTFNTLRWRKRGWYFNGQWLGTRKGLVGSVERWLPAPKMQFVRWQQGPIQKWLGIGTLTIASASITYRLRDIRTADALKLQAEMIELTRTCNLRWM